ncbi:hypothetical protein GUJ93_ZPchr0010g9995 [Zizania palustris]|uniref:Glucosyltransferase 24 catalytic domain-containing protein n=1 Tax=Zizania palustris TaxID=103762 RepID=A0A8J5WD53_ZIZPA|nr:hypothetical protein GUJ93_ZPchr0010g9995 [Zizania palustris]
MGELYDMNLKGRPLAYTPFCDNNKEMDGYRFWKQVFADFFSLTSVKGFLERSFSRKTIPYQVENVCGIVGKSEENASDMHGYMRPCACVDVETARSAVVHALYVVDLAKFRQTAAGDTLRVVYETLSKDPNSLSNLDQDLPNYAQHTVPIFSLPQEWLWCESWCGNATKARAKTIDLCNNPMTKEPKLQGARRIVPEWVDIDSEARHFTARILGDNQELAEATSPPSDTPKPHDKDTSQNLKDEL